MAKQVQVQWFSNLGLELIQAADVTHRLSRHAHDALCVGIIEKGARECEVQGTKSLAGAGQLVLVNRGEFHACASAGGMPYSYLMLCLDVSCLRKLYCQYTGNEASMPYFNSSVINDSQSFADVVRLGNLLSGSSAQLEKETQLIEMFDGLMMRHSAERTKARVIGREDNMVRQILEYVEAHCTEEISLDSLSRLVNFSPYYLHRVFTAQVGIPLHAYQMLHRINRAKEMLVQGKSYAMAAAQSGFVDQSHFSRRFKEVIGLTPGQWREARMVN